jgi:hypothetical protein
MRNFGTGHFLYRDLAWPSAYVCFGEIVASSIDKLEALVGIPVHDDWHAGNEHKDGRDWYGAVVPLVQDQERLFLRRLAVCPTCGPGGRPGGRPDIASGK